MLVTRKLGNLNENDVDMNQVDWLPLEWYETGKRMQRKTTNNGQECILKFLDQAPDFTDGDILFQDAQRIVAVQIIPCECLVISINSMYEMASLAYEIGNKHLPLFYEEGEDVVQALQSPVMKLANGDETIADQVSPFSSLTSATSFLLVPMDLPLSRLLTAQGYSVSVQQKKLLRPLKTTVSPHGNSAGTSLFSRIMQLTNPEK